MNRLTSDIDDAFFPRLQEIADEVVARPRDLLSVWYSESGVRAAAHNPHGHASGIFQVMPATLMGLGWSKGHEAYRKLTATEQLEWALRYYRAYRGSLVSIGAVYTATFLPVFVKRAGDPSFVLCAQNGPLGWAYGPNAVFDKNKDFKITVGELEAAVARNCVGPRWAELVARLEGKWDGEDLVEAGFDLRTTIGLQRALSRLGHDPGPIDGIPGAKTAAAVLAFQKARGLVADGIYGPITRATLELALQTSA